MIPYYIPFMLALLPLRGLRLGPMRLTPYGVCAAAGVTLAMALSGRAARRVELRPDAAWDAGLFAVICCFIASRLLLVAMDFRAFLRYPVLVLSLPSLTFTGMGLAALLVWIYLRRKRLPVLRVLDAFAPCGAVLAAFLELGHLLDGSEPGMPLSATGAGQASRLIPVSLYGVLSALALAALLWVVLSRLWPTGRAAALGLLLGGALAFGLDMLSLPAELASDLLVEPGQIVALLAMTAGAVLWAASSKAERAGISRSAPANTGAGDRASLPEEVR